MLSISCKIFTCKVRHDFCQNLYIRADVRLCLGQNEKDGRRTEMEIHFYVRSFVCFDAQSACCCWGPTICKVPIMRKENGTWF